MCLVFVAGHCIGGAAECTQFQRAIADVNFLKIRASYCPEIRGRQKIGGVDFSKKDVRTDHEVLR